MKKLLLSLLLVCSPVFTADELRWVPLASFAPDGALLTVYASDIGATYDMLEHSPLADVFCKGAFAQRLEEEGVTARIDQKKREIEQFFGIDLLSTLDSLMGSEMVFSFYPGESRNEPYFSLLMRGKEGTDTAGVLDSLWNTLVTHGEATALSPVATVETEIKHYRGNDGNDVYTAAHGEHAVITNSAEIAENVIALAAGRKYNSILYNPRLKKTAAGFPEDSQVKVFIDVQQILKQEPVDSRKVPVAFLRRTIESLEGIGMAFTIGRTGVDVLTRITADENNLPRFILDAAERPAQQSKFAEYFTTDDPVLGGMSVHVHPKELVDAMLAEMPQEQHQMIQRRLSGIESFILGGKSILNDLIPSIGPNVTMIATAKDGSAAQAGPVPLDLTLLVEINDETKRKEVVNNLIRSLHGFAQLHGGSNGNFDVEFTENDGAMMLSGSVNGTTPTVVSTQGAMIMSSSKQLVDKIMDRMNAVPYNNLNTILPPFKGSLTGINLSLLGKWMVENAELLGRGPGHSPHDMTTLGRMLSQLSFVSSQSGINNNALEIRTVLSTE